VRRGGARLLLGNRSFLLFWAARTASLAGSQLARVALTVFVYSLGGGAAGVSVLLLAFTLPRLLGPFAGALADRVDNKRFMVSCDLAQAVLYVVMAWVRWWPGVIGLVLAATLCATLYFPAGRSNVPALAGRENLARANTLLAIGANTALAAGPAVGGIMLVFGGPGAALLVNAATFVFSAALTTRIRGLRRGSADRSAGAPVTLYGVARAGIGIVWRNPVTRAFSIMLPPAVAFASLDNAALIFLVRKGFHAGPGAYAWVVTAFSLGMVGMPVLLSAMRRSLGARTMLFGGEGLFGATAVATGLAPGLAAGIGAQFIAGAANGMESIGLDTVLQESSPESELGAVFGTVYTFPYLGQLLAYLAATPIIVAFGARSTFVVSGVGVLVVLALSAGMISSRLSEAVASSAPEAHLPAHLRPVGQDGQVVHRVRMIRAGQLPGRAGGQSGELVWRAEQVVEP
jgi:MFS family permease